MQLNICMKAASSINNKFTKDKIIMLTYIIFKYLFHDYFFSVVVKVYKKKHTASYYSNNNNYIFFSTCTNYTNNYLQRAK